MVVLVTGKNEEDPIKNEGARVLKTLSIYTHGKKLGNTNFFRFSFHLDSDNYKTIDKTRIII